MGQALKITQPGWTYLDVSDDSLSFTGNTNNLESFTVGFYVKGVSLHNFVWAEIIPHNFNPSTDYAGFLSTHRFAYRLTAISAFELDYNNGACNAVNRVYNPKVPTELQGQWQHVAYSFDKVNSEFKSYLNGFEAHREILASSQTCGTAGAFAILYISLLELYLD